MQNNPFEALAGLGASPEDAVERYVQQEQFMLKVLGALSSHTCGKPAGEDNQNYWSSLVAALFASSGNDLAPVLLRANCSAIIKACEEQIDRLPNHEEEMSEESYNRLMEHFEEDGANG